MGQDFTPEQKRFLEGFASGLQATRAAQGMAGPSVKSGAAMSPSPPNGPDRAHFEAMARAESEGGKLADQEKWKRDAHPFDAYHRLEAQAQANEFPKPPDNFRWRYFGLFYVAPAQNSYMCRLRIPNGILKHWQLSGLAALTDEMAGGYCHVTTRANLQIREIAAANATAVLEAIQDLGLCSRGSGADNIRNVTGDATAGIAPGELIDTRPLARAWHFHILNDRSLTGLPRKFNVAFDGGGPIPTLEETNDIGFQAVEIGPGSSVPAGIWFRLLLGGITGHGDLARDTGVLIRPEDCVRVADAVVRVFIDHGDRTDRTKARLKYLLARFGFERFLAVVEAKLGIALTRVPETNLPPRPAQNRFAHVGAHPQVQAGRFWLGVVLPVGRMTSTQMRSLADIAHAYGDGDLRLTVWQNLLISGIAEADLVEAKKAVEACGLDWRATSLRAGLVACTGSRGCKFAAADTKAHAEAIASWCEDRLALDVPINIHLTGCHHSCAQHMIADVGLIGARVGIGEDGDTVDGYDIVLGGGFGAGAAIGRTVAKAVPAGKVPQVVEALLSHYMSHRSGPEESFQTFVARSDGEALRATMAGVPA